MTITKQVALAWLALLPACLWAQEDPGSRDITRTLEQNRTELLFGRKFVYGISATITVEFGMANTGQYRLSLDGAIAKTVGSPQHHLAYSRFMIAYQPELLLFRGGLGSSQGLGQRGHLNFELRNMFSITAGYADTQQNQYFTNRCHGRPMSIFAGNSGVALYDPYDMSVTIGTIFVNRIGSPVKQQIGALTVGIFPMQLNYTNEGPIFNAFLMPTGDGYDRWWTGGGKIGFYNSGHKSGISKIEAVYDKYTGWQPNCYEAARRLGLKYTPYKDTREALLNQSRYMVLVQAFDRFTAGVGIYDPRLFDMQNAIHTLGRYPFHQTQLKDRYSGIWQYQNLNTQPLK